MRKQLKKSLAFLLTLAMLFSLLPAGGLALVEENTMSTSEEISIDEALEVAQLAMKTAVQNSDVAAVSLAEWNFTTMTLPPLPPTTPPWETTLYATGGADSYATLTTNATNGWGTSPSNFLAANGFDGPAGAKYWQVDFPIGMSYTGLTLNSNFRVSGSITGRWYISARVYGTDEFVKVEGSDFTITKTGGAAGPVTWDSGAENCTLPDHTVAARFVCNEGDGKTTASSGNAYINNIIVMGVPTEQLPQLAVPMAAPAPGKVLADTPLLLSHPNEDDVTIYYSTTVSDAHVEGWTEYDADHPPIISEETRSFYAYATDPLGRQTDSAVKTFSYTLLATSSVSAAKAGGDGATVMVEAVASQAYTSSLSELGCYMQDETGGILVLSDDLPDIAQGDKLMVAGKLSTVNKQLALTGLIAAEVVSQGNALTPATITPDSLAAAVGTLVKVDGLNVDAISTDKSGSIALTLSAGGKKLTAALNKGRVAAPSVTAIINDTVSVTGIVVPAGSGYQVELRSNSDLAVTAPAMLVAPPTADRSEALRLPVGASVHFTSLTPGATFEYTESVPSGETVWQAVPSEGLVFPGSAGDKVTRYVRAVKDSLTPSSHFTLTYELKPSAADTDPIADSDITGGALNIVQASAITSADDRQTYDVVGQIVYRYGTTADKVSAAILQDVVDGDIVSLSVGNALSTYKIGDIVKITMTKNQWSGSYTYSSAALVKAAAQAPHKLAPQEFNTVADLLKYKGELAYAVVSLKSVTLGAYNATKTTTVTDSAKKAIELSKPFSYPTGVTQGDVVDLTAVMPANTSVAAPQLSTGPASGNDYPPYTLLADTQGPIITLPAKPDNAKKGGEYTVSVDVVDYSGVKSVKLIYTINGTPSAEVDMTKKSGSTYTYTIPGSAIATGGTMTLKVTAADSQSESKISTVTSGSIAILDEPLIVSVTPESGSSSDTARPALSITFENAGEAPTVKLSLSLLGGEAVLTDAAMTVSAASAAYALASDLAEGKYTASATLTRGDGKSATKSWSFTVGEPGYTAYFGQLHSHTGEYSDGAGLLSDALDYVKAIPEEDNVSFVAFTDHSNYFDTLEAPNPAEALGDTSKMTAESKKTWDTYRNAINKWNTSSEGRLCMAGFEMTWAGGPGHMNTFNSTGLVSRNNPELNDKANKTKDAGMQRYYEELSKPENEATISQFNHPGTTFGTFTDFAHWDPAIDSRVTLIEVGNGAGPVNMSGYFPSYNYYINALDKGWHVAPTNNQDNHKANWGNANTARTVIYTTDFSVDGLYDGMRNMHLYSTEDKNLEISYFINGNMMGSIMDKPEIMRVTGEIKDPDGEPLGKIQLVSNGGRIVYETTCDEASFTLDTTLEPKYSYYFLQVTQPDRDMAVTAPVWVGESTKMGITSVYTDAPIVIEGESIDVMTDLYNYDKSPLTLTSIEYALTQGSTTTVLSTATEGLGAVESQQTVEKSFSYTPTASGRQSINVTVNATLDGTPYVFKAKLDIEAIAAAELTSVAIDVGHSNYVLTDAAETELSALAGINSIRLVPLEKGQLTYENLKNFSLVILTTPYSATGASLADSLYTQEELSALQKYAGEGGSFIITARSDRGGSNVEKERASVVANQLLSAIGAKAKISNSTVVDTVRNTGKLYRMPLTGNACFNYDAMTSDELAACVLSGVSASSSNTFQIYDSAAVIPNGSTVLVRGFRPSTMSVAGSDLTGDTALKPGAAQVTAPGSTYVLTSETLPGGGFAVVSGAPFFATAQMHTDIDTPEDKQNANYFIMQNLFDSVKAEPTITDIADVHKLPEGVRCTIEGVATTNASGYDKDTAFFDCIYLQDETGGVNVFPVAGNIQAGQRLRVVGYTSSYQGERQLEAGSVEVVDVTPKTVSPKLISTKEAAESTYMGTLVKLQGTVTSFTQDKGVVETIMVRDGSGVEGRIFIDGYITKDKTIANLAVGCDITAVGLASYDDTFDGIPARIRIFDRAQIVCTASQGGSTGSPSTPPSKPELKPSATVKDGVASAQVSDSSFSKLVSNAVNSKSNEMTIIPAYSGKADTVSVTVSRDAIAVAVSKTGAALTISTPNGSLTLPAAALKAIADTKGKDVTLSVKQSDKDFTVTVSVGGTALDSVSGGVRAALPTADATASTVAVLLKADGTEEILGKSALSDGNLSVLLDGSATVHLMDNGKRFSDVPAGRWDSEGIAFAAARGLLIGIDAEQFLPGGNMDRSMVVTMLYRLERAKAGSLSDFADVSPNAWYADAVAWAVEHGIAGSVGGSSFAPDRPVTRQELVVMLYRYAKPDSTATLSQTEDVSDWAQNAMAWAAECGILQGDSQGKLNPTATATRAEVAVILQRFITTLVTK